MGTYVDTLGRLEEQREISPEDCRTERSWNRNDDEDVLRMTFDARTDEDMIALQAVEGTTACSLEVLMEIQPKFTEHLKNSQEEARLERRTSVGYAGQV